LFPTNNSTEFLPNACNIDNAMTADFGEDVVASIPAAGATLRGGTPIQKGLTVSHDYLVSVADEAAQAMILITDGAISCNNQGTAGTNTQAGAEAEIADALATDDIPTYVVGIDILSGVVSDMNEYALAGGVPKDDTGNGERFYNASNQLELQAALDDIVESVVSCEIQLSIEPLFPALTVVSINGVDYPLISAADCATTDGWYYSVVFSEITLCSAACSNFKSSQTADVEYYCIAG
jgi:hypothetical protein